MAKLKNSTIFSHSLTLLVVVTITLMLNSCKQTTPPPDKGLVIYRSSNIKGYQDKPIIIDYPFVKTMNTINNYAKESNITLYVTSSFRKVNQKVKGAIVTPARRSNHLAGHAIDMNISYKGKWYDSKLMNKNNFNKLPVNIRSFFNKIRNNPNIRWGGDFSRQDPVHIDDYLNKNHKLWLIRYKKCQYFQN